MLTKDEAPDSGCLNDGSVVRRDERWWSGVNFV